VAVCDTNAQRLQAAADAYRLQRTFGSLDAMLSECALDGVVIATPHATHAALTRACLERGLHVLLEKPMTLYAADAQRLVALAGAHGPQLIVGYPWNFAPQVIRARECLQSGALGAVQYVSCTMASSVAGLLQGDERYLAHAGVYPVHGPGAVYSDLALSGGGQGHLQITHAAGLLFFITGLRARRVLALMHNHGLPLDLVDAMTVGFEGGALGLVGGTGNSPTHKLDLMVRCERGGLDLDVDSQTLTVYHADRTTETFGPAPESTPALRIATTHNLVEVILGLAPNGSPAEVGWRTVELLDAAYRSAARDGQSVWIKDLYTDKEPA
jgi:predicted dehydrogenase